MGAPSDAEVLRDLVERIRHGDEKAETEVVSQFSKRIFVMSLVRTRDREASRDLVQDVLIAVIGALRKGQLQDPSKLPAFVHGTARNLINNRMRTEIQSPALEPLPEDLPQITNNETLEESEQSQLVHEALNELGEDDRSVLWMTLVEGRKPGDIASILGLTSEVVRTRKSRAIKRVIEIVKRKLSRSQADLPHRNKE